ncbi:TPA: SGNH/GDSL hydrolase family protein [Enterobacter asburiae]|nr:SGNH/GDSL hydrolase family protein [Enterobacter asburiae]
MMNRRKFAKLIVAGAGLMTLPRLATAKPSRDRECGSMVNNLTLLTNVKDKLSSGESVRIDCYGDSVIWGSTPFDIAKQSNQSAPKVLESVLRNIFQNKKVIVNNFGIQGSTLLGFVSGDDHSQGNIELKAKNKADVIYLNYGINDALQNIPLEQYRLALHRAINACHENGVALVFVTPNVMGVNGFGSLKKSSRLKLYVEEMKSVATERSIEVVDQFAMTTRDTLKHHPKTIIPDGAHLSDSNYNQLGHNLSLPMVNYAELRKGDTFKFISADFGTPNVISVATDNCELLVSGSGLKTICIPLLMDEETFLSVEVSGKKVYLNLNGAFRGINSDNTDLRVNINGENDRTGLKLLSISSNDEFTLKSIKAMAF